MLTLLRIAGLTLIVVGAAMIVFSRNLAAWYEGSTITMSDLGFIAGGMMLVMLGLMVLLGLLITIILQHRR